MASRNTSCGSLRTGHLFAGAGGGIYADFILGHRPQFAVEWEAYPCQILRQQFPDMHVHEGDARLFDASEWAGRVDSLHAGFPCQDISVAGMGGGIEGERSGLWSELVRCAAEIRPAELFLENSPAIVSRGLDRVLSDLAALGFDAEWCCLPAAGVGAPHRRDRWWCLARRADTNLKRCDELELRVSDYGQALADASIDRLQGQRETGAETETADRSCDGSNFGWWQIEPDLGRVADGVADRVNRIKALGNGQVPLQAAIAYILLDRRYA